MEITATSKYDLKAVTALVRLSAFKKRNPKKCLILSLVIAGFVFACAIFLLCLSDGVFPILYLIWSAAFIFIQLYIYLWLPKIQYRAMGKFADSCQTF